ncbi:unnamed protein product [marine sediment metagenome]|uniref:Uncharacterized protein n=1 Tax=marine sediment metagenome TaxID=412755 RepID=X0WU15_9ZZZZ
MADLIREMENKYIESKKEEFKKAGGTMSHVVELAMRSAYSTAAIVFRTLGRHEGDESRKKRIVEALGLIEEESEA